jgi:hypothetical protein
MDARSQAVAAICQAETQIRNILQRLAGEGDYDSLQLLADWARQLRQMSQQAGSAALNGRPAAAIPLSTAVQTEARPKPPSGHRRGRSKTPDMAYPKFLRDREELVKIGWSRKQKREYRHKAPKAAVLLVAQALEQKRVGGERFAFEEVLPIRDSHTGADVPSYQAYTALAWLRKEGLIVQHGRQGYSLVPNIGLMDAIEERWKLLSKS